AGGEGAPTLGPVQQDILGQMIISPGFQANISLSIGEESVIAFHALTNTYFLIERQPLRKRLNLADHGFIPTDLPSFAVQIAHQEEAREDSDAHQHLSDPGGNEFP